MHHVSLRATGGLRLHALRWDGGDRTPVLCVHGLSSNARLWSQVGDHLAAAGHPVVAVDQRGHGRSDKPDHGYDFPTVVADLVAVLDDLGWDRAVVAGQSWGGNVVAHLAAAHPERLTGVVCVDGGWLALRDRFASWEACLERLTPPRLAGMALRRLEAAVRAGHPHWSHEAVAATLDNMEHLADGSIRPWLTLERHLAILRSMWEDDIWAVWPRIAVPAALVPAEDGSGRQRGDVERAAAVAADVRVHWFGPPADHDLHAEHPSDVAAIIGNLG